MRTWVYTQGEGEVLQKKRFWTGGLDHIAELVCLNPGPFMYNDEKILTKRVCLIILSIESGTFTYLQHSMLQNSL